VHDDEEVGLRFEQPKRGQKKVSVSTPKEEDDSDS